MKKYFLQSLLIIVPFGGLQGAAESSAPALPRGHTPSTLRILNLMKNSMDDVYIKYKNPKLFTAISFFYQAQDLNTPFASLFNLKSEVPGDIMSRKNNVYSAFFHFLGIGGASLDLARATEMALSVYEFPETLENGKAVDRKVLPEDRIKAFLILNEINHQSGDYIDLFMDENAREWLEEALVRVKEYLENQNNLMSLELRKHGITILQEAVYRLAREYHTRGSRERASKWLDGIVSLREISDGLRKEVEGLRYEICPPLERAKEWFRANCEQRKNAMTFTTIPQGPRRSRESSLEEDDGISWWRCMANATCSAFLSKRAALRPSVAYKPGDRSAIHAAMQRQPSPFASSSDVVTTSESGEVSSSTELISSQDSSSKSSARRSSKRTKRTSEKKQSIG